MQKEEARYTKVEAITSLHYSTQGRINRPYGFL